MQTNLLFSVVSGFVLPPNGICVTSFLRLFGYYLNSFNFEITLFTEVGVEKSEIISALLEK